MTKVLCQVEIHGHDQDGHPLPAVSVNLRARSQQHAAHTAAQWPVTRRMLAPTIVVKAQGRPDYRITRAD